MDKSISKIQINGELYQIKDAEAREVADQVESHNFGENNQVNAELVALFGDNNVIGAKGFNIVGYMANSVANRTGFRVEIADTEISDAVQNQPVSVIIDGSSTARFANVVSYTPNGDGTADIIVDKYWLEQSFNPANSNQDYYNGDAIANNGQWITNLKDNDNFLIFPTLPEIGNKVLAGMNTAIGSNNNALLQGSIAIGYQNSAEGKWATALGRGNKAGYAALTSGRGNNALGAYAVALGNGNNATGDMTFASGWGNTASAESAHAQGRDNVASGKQSIARGKNSQAVGENSIAEGEGAIATGYTAIASGYGARAEGDQSRAENLNTTAKGLASHAEGMGSVAEGKTAHAEGISTIASGVAAHTEGSGTNATSAYAHAEGAHTISSGEGAHAEGNGTKAESYSSHAEGTGTTASGAHSHAEGLNTKTTQAHSHAEGYYSQATGLTSHAEGDMTVASGANSHTQNAYTQAKGYASSAAGYETVAGFDNQFVIGVYNDNKEDNIFEVGIGVNENSKENGFEVKKDGTVYSKEGKLATEAVVDSKIAALVDSAPDELNTLKELADALNDQESEVAAILEVVSKKVDKVDGKQLSTNDFTNAYKNQLDNEIVGEFTVDGSDYVQDDYEEIRGERFNDYDDAEGNKALAPGSHAEGTRSIIVEMDTSTTIPTVTTSTMQNIAGCMCYEIHSGTIGSLYYNPSVTINNDRSGVISLKGHVISDTSSHGSGPLEVGDVISVIVDGNADNCGKITKIEETTTGLLKTKVTKISVDYLPELVKTGLTVYSVLPFILKVNDKPFTGTKALGLGAHTEGVGNQALSDGAHAEGRENKAVGRWSHAEGWNNIAHYASHAEGWETQAKGIASHAEGRQTISAMHSSHAEGYMTQAIADQTHAEGLETIAAANCSHAEGTHSQASGYASHTEGYYTSVRDISGETLLDGDDAYVVPADHGTTKWGSGSGAHAEGQNTVASSDGAHAEGNLTYAVGSCCHAEGHKTIADGYQSHSEGYNTKAVGNYAHSEGTRTEASGIASHAEGNYNKATGESSHAQGQKTTASGKHSHAEGYSTTACGGQSHAEGDGTIAEGTGSHAEGYKTSAIGNQSHAEGNGAIAEGTNAHAEGRATKATKHAAHAEGSNTQATGDQSHAEGLFTIASGARAHAEGWSTEAKVGGTHSAGIATVAGYVGQTVVGIANENKADNLFEVGNGSYNVESDKAIASTRSNAFEVKKTGVAIAGGKTLATEQYVQQEIAKMVDSAPETLNTLNELADALGNDPNFATTVATEIGKKVDKVEGKGLSTNDFTNAYKEKLDNIENLGGNVSTGSDIPMEIITSATQPTPVEGKTIIWIDISKLS